MVQYLHTISAGHADRGLHAGTHLRIIEGFTTDSSTIERLSSQEEAIRSSRPVMDPTFDQALSDATTLRVARSDGVGANRRCSNSSTTTKLFEMQLRSEMTIDAMDQLARYLSTVPGRIDLIWFAGSMPFNPQTGSRPDQDQLADLRDQAQDMLELLAGGAGGVVSGRFARSDDATRNQAETNIQNPNLMNSVSQTRGAERKQQIGFESDPAGRAGKPAELQAEAASSRTRHFLDQLAFDHLNMEEFAKETGGKASSIPMLLEKRVGDAHRGWIGLLHACLRSATPKFNDAYRKIDVRMDESNYTLEYRRGYYDDDPATTPKAMPGRISPLIAAMQHG